MSRHGTYAQEVQRACADALRNVQEHRRLGGDAWAEPLIGALASTSTMVLLLRTTVDPHVEALTLSPLAVLDARGHEVGRLKWVPHLE